MCTCVLWHVQCAYVICDMRCVCVCGTVCMFYVYGVCGVYEGVCAMVCMVCMCDVCGMCGVGGGTGCVVWQQKH